MEKASDTWRVGYKVVTNDLSSFHSHDGYAMRYIPGHGYWKLKLDDTTRVWNGFSFLDSIEKAVVYRGKRGSKRILEIRYRDAWDPSGSGKQLCSHEIYIVKAVEE